ncbi:MAG: hypothetical protein AAGC46_11665 [Solirubrobacteraceae bacterium]
MAAAGITAALALGIGGKGLDVISEARAAVAPGAYVLHVRTEARWPDASPGGAKGMTTINDTWSATSPMRWRVRQSFTDDQVRRGGASDMPRSSTPEEFAYADGAQSTYDPRGKLMSVITGFSPTGVVSRPPTVVAMVGAGAHAASDPVATIRELLDRGDVRDIGTASVDGHAVRRLVGIVPLSKGQPKLGVEADVDASTFAPVRLRYHPLASGLRKWSQQARLTWAALGAFEVHFTAYERLPVTPATEALLKIHPAPGTKIRTTSHDALMAKFHRGSHCHRIKNGNMKCRQVR